jgi:hypothetical protein
MHDDPLRPTQSLYVGTVYLCQEVATLVNGEHEAGYHEIKFDRSNRASGICIYWLQAGMFVQTKRLLML